MGESARYVDAEMECKCGTELLVHWQARTGIIIGNILSSVQAGGWHGVPDVPIHLFRRVGNKWLSVEYETD